MEKMFGPERRGSRQEKEGEAENSQSGDGDKNMEGLVVQEEKGIQRKRKSENKTGGEQGD